MAKSEDSDNPQEERALVPLEGSSSLVPSNIPQLPVNKEQEQVIDTALKDDQVWSRFLLIGTIFGTVLIFGALAEVATGYLILALAQGIIGALIDAITILIQNPRREARERADTIYNNFIEAERFNAAIQLAATMEGEARNRVTEAIINRLIEQVNKPQEISSKQERRVKPNKSKKQRTKQLSSNKQKEDALTNENNNTENINE